MEHGLPEMLLLDNAVYLEAVQHKKVKVNSLGLKEVSFSFQSSRAKKDTSILQAVVPEFDQMDFMLKSGATTPQVLSSLGYNPPHIEHRVKENRTEQLKSKRKKRLEAKEKEEKEKADREKSAKAAAAAESMDPNYKNTPARRTSIGGTPMYTKPSHTSLKIHEREVEDAIYRDKLHKRFKKLGTNFDIIEDGVKYVYNYEGMKVPEDVYYKQQEEIERQKRRKSVKAKPPPHGVALIEKSKKFVEELRMKVETVRTHNSVFSCFVCFC
jgi:hypothetical protein